MRLLDQHPASIPPDVWGPIVADGLRSIDDIVRVVVATVDEYIRSDLLSSVARVLDLDSARQLLARGCLDGSPSVGVAALAVAAADFVRAGDELRACFAREAN